MHPRAQALAARLFSALVTFWLVTSGFFALIELAPNDFASATATRDTSRAQIESLRYRLGLFVSAPERYVEWLGDVLTGDLGNSWLQRKPVAPIVMESLGHSLWLVWWATLFAMPIAIAAAALATMWRWGLFDRITSVGAIIGMSLPEFLIAYMLMALLAVRFGLFPAHTMYVFDMPLGDRLWASALPILSVAAVTITPVFRMTRAALINELRTGYAEMAVLKGVGRFRLIWRHIAPNVAAPIANSILLAIANLFVGLVIIESIFSYPGIGQLIFNAASVRDAPMALGCALATATIHIGLTLLADLIAIACNPRLRDAIDAARAARPQAPPAAILRRLYHWRRPALLGGAVIAILYLVVAPFLRDAILRADFTETPPPKKIRDALTVAELTGVAPPPNAPLHYAYFDMFAPSEPAAHRLNGRITTPVFRAQLRFLNQGAQSLASDFPNFAFDVVSDGELLLPLQHDQLLRSDLRRWSVILSAGRVWREPGDGDWSRASLPFTLTPTRGVEPHYGVATFLFNDSAVSQIRVQVAQETANWAQYDLWGQVAATYQPAPRPINLGVLDSYKEARARRRFEVRPWSALEEGRWRSLESFDGRGNRENIAASGLLIDDTLFLRPCRTRAGPHPHCRDVRFGVFSISKSLGAAISMLWLAEEYGPQIFDARLIDYIDIPASHDGWRDVTFGHALDMVTGIGDILPYRVDHYVEADSTPIGAMVWCARSVRAKLKAAARFPSYPWGPGEVFRYRTADTTVLSAAMQAFLRVKEGADADLWSRVSEQVFRPLGIQRIPVKRTEEPDGRPGVPLLGAGMFVTIDDALRLGRFQIGQRL